MENWWFNISKILLLITTSSVLMGQEVLFNKTEDFTPQFETFNGQIKRDTDEIIGVIAKKSTIPGLEYDSTLLVSYDQFGCELWKTSHYFHELLVEKVFIENTIKENLTVVSFYIDDLDPEGILMVGVIEFSYEGELLNFYTYGWNTSNDGPLSAKVLPDGGLIIVGRRNLNIGGVRGFVLRTDVNGDLLWDFTYGDVEASDVSNVFSSVEIGPNGNFWILVNASIDGAGTILLELNDLGEIVGEQVNLFPLFLENSDVVQNHIHFLNDSTYLIAATNNLNGSIEHTALASFTIEGALNWLYYAEPFSEVVDDRTEGMEVLPNGDVLLCGFERETENEYPINIGWIKKFNKDGQLLWDTNFIPFDDCGLELFDAKLNDLDLMDDGSIWVGGSANYLIPGSPYLNTKVWLMRIDTSGNFITDLSASLIQENEVFCVGEAVNITLDLSSTNGCYETEWLVNDSLIISDNKNTLLFNPTTSGTYEVVCNLVDDTGQNLSVSTQIEIDSLTPLTLPSTDTIATEEILDLGEISYFDETEWQGSGTEYLYEEEGRLYFANASLGDYELILDSDCLGQQTMTIVVDTETGIPSIEYYEVKISPNPATIFVAFSFPSLNQTTTLRIYDALGRLQAEAVLERGSKQNIIDVSNLPNGLYYWSLGEWRSGKFIKR